jgi:hypothetical protein
VLHDPEGSHYNRVRNLADEIAASFSRRTRNDRQKGLAMTKRRRPSCLQGMEAGNVVVVANGLEYRLRFTALVGRL